jgi:hypothetical protein
MAIEHEEERRDIETLSTSSNEPDENTALISGREAGHTLYRTLSRISTQEQTLPTDDADVELSKAEDTSPSAGIWATLSVLLVGVFVSQTDQSLVLATYSTVSSEFQDLDSGTWLISAYIIAQCAVQPLYGKLR